MSRWEQGPLTEIDYSITDEELSDLKTEGVTGVIVDWPEDAYAAASDSPATAGFDDLLRRVEAAGLNAIVDLKPATSSAWFARSEGREAAYADYYVWRAGGSFNASGVAEPPNNWLSRRNASAWKYSDARKEFYLSPDDAPLLNFRNPRVVGEFSSTLSRLATHCKGVRLTGAPRLLVDDSFGDESIDTSRVGFTHLEYGFYAHARTEYLAELGPLLGDWRRQVKQATDNGPFMLSEELRTLEPFKVNNSLVIDLPLQSRPLGKPVVSASSLNADLAESFGFLEGKYWPLWKVRTPSHLASISVFHN